MNYIESVVSTATSCDSPTMPAACVLPMFLTTILKYPCHEDAENGGYPPTQNGDIRSLFMLFALMAMQN